MSRNSNLFIHSLLVWWQDLPLKVLSILRRKKIKQGKDMYNSIELYDEWSIQGFVLFSLSLQIILILFAPFRKRTGNMIVISLIWVAYLLADWAAIFALGLISSRQKCIQKLDDHADILVFWAPFLLLHLGGPDTVTAFSLEDNALWLRHLAGLLTQVVTASIIFGQSLPSNKLWVPTVLLFFAGTIKYGERTYALFQANLGTFRKSMLKAPNPGPDYAEFMEKYSAIQKANRQPMIQFLSRGIVDVYHEPHPDAIAEVRLAYHFFEMFKGLIVDHIFNIFEHQESRKFFGQRTAEVVLKVVAVELNFFYTVLYTKDVVIRSIFGYFARFISSCAVVAALSTFYSLDKHGFGKIDVGITYTLLFGAIALDTVALFMLAFSDWTVAVASTQQSTMERASEQSEEASFASTQQSTMERASEQSEEASVASTQQSTMERASEQSEEASVASTQQSTMESASEQSEEASEQSEEASVYSFPYTQQLWNKILKGINRCFLHLFRCSLPLFRYFLHLKKINWGEDIESMSCLGRARRILFRRWHESLDTFNFIDYCLQERSQKNLTPFNYVSEKLGLKDFYDQMKYVSKKPLTKKLWIFIFDELIKKSSDFASHPENEEKLYLTRGYWVLQNIEGTIGIESSKFKHHIADVDYDESLMLWHIATELCYHTESGIDNESGIDSTNRREFCKIISDYMLYLLVMQPTMMSAVAGIGQRRFRDTCAEAKRFFDKKVDLGQEQDQEHEQACTRILEVNTEVEPALVKGNISKSVLFDACILAKELGKLEGQKRWGLMSEVWVELLSHAASHCKANTHVAQLSKGGELITFVWLLTAHLGIGDHFLYSTTGIGGAQVFSE